MVEAENLATFGGARGDSRVVSGETREILSSSLPVILLGATTVFRWGSCEIRRHTWCRTAGRTSMS